MTSCACAPGIRRMTTSFVADAAIIMTVTGTFVVEVAAFPA
jgi:hypothetical protein